VRVGGCTQRQRLLILIFFLLTCLYSMSRCLCCRILHYFDRNKGTNIVIFWLYANFVHNFVFGFLVSGIYTFVLEALGTWGERGGGGGRRGEGDDWNRGRDRDRDRDRGKGD